MSLNSLINKYGQAVPRYTSYPTAPEWKDKFDLDIFHDAIKRSNLSQQDYSLYLHIPFCEAQCYYCACNVVISPEHGIEQKYLDQLKRELEYYGQLINPERKVVQMAWGGGTPTFLTPEQIDDLYSCIRENFGMYHNHSHFEKLPYAAHEYAIELDPRVTHREHLEVLHELGFNRLSMGIQDFNPQTQEAINRIQSYDSVASLVQSARDIGFTSINFDLIYGLPFQTLETFTSTIEDIKQLNPERIALFNYAHLPSLLPFQRKYIKDDSLPDQKTKLAIFDKAVDEFCNFGYDFIGLDHFAKPNDSLSLAQKSKTLYRNFQGYTTHSGIDLFGFGITSISDVQGVYKQSPKKLNDYYDDFLQAEKFKISSVDDQLRREVIKQIMCNNYVEINKKHFAQELALLQCFVDDALLDISETNDTLILQVTELGRFFVRNIASCFDAYLQREGAHRLFSKAL